VRQCEDTGLNVVADHDGLDVFHLVVRHLNASRLGLEIFASRTTFAHFGISFKHDILSVDITELAHLVEKRDVDDGVARLRTDRDKTDTRNAIGLLRPSCQGPHSG
jgi:hypothetical protein